MQDRLLKNIYLCLILLSVVCIAVTFHYMQAVLVPFVFSLFVYTACAPLVGLIEKKLRIPKALSILIVLITLFITVTLLLVFVSNSIGDFVKGADIYKERVILWTKSMEGKLHLLGMDPESINLEEQLKKLKIFNAVKDVTRIVTNFMSNFFLIGIFTLFLLMGATAAKVTNPFVESLQNKISKYLITKLSTSLTTGILVWIILAIANVELAFMFAVLTFLLNFIPNIGSIIAVAIPIPIILLQYQLGWQFWLAVCGSGSIQFLIGNVLEPKIMGESLDLHPVTILLFLIVWGQIWGLPGMFLSVPITAIMKIVFDRIEETKPFAELLAGRLPK